MEYTLQIWNIRLRYGSYAKHVDLLSILNTNCTEPSRIALVKATDARTMTTLPKDEDGCKVGYSEIQLFKVINN